MNGFADVTQKIAAGLGGIALAAGGVAITVASGGLAVPIGGAMMGAGLSSAFQVYLKILNNRV